MTVARMKLVFVILAILLFSGCSRIEKESRPVERDSSDTPLAERFPSRPDLPTVPVGTQYDLAEDQPGGSPLPEIQVGNASALREAQQGPDTREGAERFALEVAAYLIADLPRAEALPVLEAVSRPSVVRGENGLNQSQGLPWGKYVKEPTEMWLRSRKAAQGPGWDLLVLTQTGVIGGAMDGSPGVDWFWFRSALQVAYLDGSWWMLSNKTGPGPNTQDPRDDPWPSQSLDLDAPWRKTQLVP